MCVRTDENPKVFVLCGFCRPGANARGKTRKNSKKRRSAAFLTLSGRHKAALCLTINPGVVKGRLPLKLYSGSDGMHVRTDENPEVFVLCRFCRPGA